MARTKTNGTKYRAGDTFTCWRASYDPRTDEVGEPCGADVRMHGYHWVQQICPQCLQTYRVTTGNDVVVMPGYWPADTRQRIEDNIKRNGGQYVPSFD